jgi:hypothetical protein
MDVDAATTTFITCAAPTCDTRVPATESVYVDGAGQLCEACAGPLQKLNGGVCLLDHVRRACVIGPFGGSTPATPPW